MSQLITYLTFNGNCREAMTFYQECLGGELYIQTVGETPMAAELPDHIRDYVLHASLRRDDLMLMGTDMVEDQALVKGNAVAILLDCDSEEEVMSCYRKLARNGYETHPPEPNHWNDLLGDLTDRYGNHWLLRYSVNEHLNY